MKRLLAGLFVIGVVLIATMSGCSDESSVVTPPQQQQSAAQAPILGKVQGAQYVDGAYIVVLKDVVPNVANVVEELRQRLNFSVDLVYTHALKGFAVKLPAAVIEALRLDPRVAYIEQDQIAYAFAVQANPPSWGLDRIDQRALPLSTSYTYNATGAGVDAYIIDTGIRVSHTDFGGRAVAGYDAITSGGTADDGNGHGTHVAGTVGGTTYGVAKGVHLIAVRVLNNSGSGTYSQVIAGIDWVTGNHTTNPAVANMSLGGSVSTALDDAVRRSIADGITYCVAAGNSSTNASTQSPADVAEAITVGATSNTDAFASFSNYGSIVDILAPGVNITSDWNTSNTATNTISGTSMASPHVTGAAALYLEANPSATPAQVASALTGAATSGTITGVPGGTANLLLFTTQGGAPPPSPPPAPTLRSPSNGATGVSRTPTLVWNASTGADSYRLQVSRVSSFTSTVYDRAGLTGTSSVVSGLGSATTYYWRVNATSTNGTGAWSSTWRFRTTR